MKKIIKCVAIFAGLACLYLGAYIHGSNLADKKSSQEIVSTGYWSESTNLYHAQEVLKVLRPQDNREAYDLVSRSFCRSLVATIKYRNSMNKEEWDVSLVDRKINQHKEFISQNPSIKDFAAKMPDGSEIPPLFRKSTYTELFEQIK